MLTSIFSKLAFVQTEWVCFQRQHPIDLFQSLSSDSVMISLVTPVFTFLFHAKMAAVRKGLYFLFGRSKKNGANPLAATQSFCRLHGDSTPCYVHLTHVVD